jgi:ABC-type proline/glycine betaine transport system ATPase subunit
MSMQDKLRDLRDLTSRFGTTSPLVTHDIDEALIAPKYRRLPNG